MFPAASKSATPNSKLGDPNVAPPSARVTSSQPMKGKLGPDFWGQWYRVDKPGTGSHTEEQLAKEVQSLSLQTTLTHEDTTISMEQMRRGSTDQ